MPIVRYSATQRVKAQTNNREDISVVSSLNKVKFGFVPLLCSVIFSTCPVSLVNAQLTPERNLETKNLTDSASTQLLIEETKSVNITDIFSLHPARNEMFSRQDIVLPSADKLRAIAPDFTGESFHIEPLNENFLSFYYPTVNKPALKEEEIQVKEYFLYFRDKNSPLIVHNRHYTQASQASLIAINNEQSTINSGSTTADEQAVSNAFRTNPSGTTPRHRLREVEAIEITGLGRLQPRYVRSRLETATTAPLEQKRLLDALQMLQRDPLIESLSVEWATGSRPGLGVLKVDVQEANAFSVQLSSDNRRSPSFGSIGSQIQLSHKNLLGFGDRLDISYVGTIGSNSLNNLSYTIPLNRHNGTFTFSQTRSTNRIITEPLDLLDIELKDRQYQLTYRQPLLRTPTEELTVGLTVSRHQLQSIMGWNDIGPFRLYEGANEEGKLTISTLRFLTQYTQRSNQHILTLSSKFSLGIGAFGATVNDDIPDSRFLSWRGQADYLRLLAPDVILLLNSDLQLSNQALLSQEKFSVGGQLSVRGYRQGILQADNGFFASAELRFPILSIPEWQTKLQLAPFFDFGTVWSSSNSLQSIDTSTIFSVGLSLLLPVGNNFSARIDWGIPLIDLETGGDTLQENGIYFSIQYRPFN
ncbi:MAG: ShlB/FhaC/HecB family hemolysin secretion/activation protein [Symploca sp. SIO1C4]|uniref:ShlB/FhaC/HecB family hemolysin secretion/activation protein n=1 Tax=Symploca sp. SIO1C4 TaxID=2607765 RepID=A0A6B3NEC9_9CYAN|nr:ShlB/FhaC/HecB family hemolysin secretion/activation protein [Symploca sp. SIO1C4]